MKTTHKNVQEGISFLNRSLFTCSKDELKEYSSNSMLYFSELPGNKYLVINHYNYSKTKPLQGFDMWVSEYKRTREIGFVKAQSIESIKLSVRFPGDIDLINRIIQDHLKILSDT